jgi:hypothetical protein
MGGKFPELDPIKGKDKNICRKKPIGSLGEKGPGRGPNRKDAKTK